MKKSMKILKSINDRLRSVVDGGALESGQKEAVLKAAKQFDHAARVEDRDQMMKAVNDLCRALMR